MTWDPAQYNRFAREREQPFWDLATLLQGVSKPVVADLGCGDGRLTAELHHRLNAASTTGYDNSEAMLSGAKTINTDGVQFVNSDVSQWRPEKRFDIIFSNAALQWIPNHQKALESWRDALASGGQLAVQIPANGDHTSHAVARELGEKWFGAEAPPDPVAENVLAPEQYSEILHSLGFVSQHVRLQVYPHVLASSSSVVEWVKGASLTRFRTRLETPDFERFVSEYRGLLLERLGDRVPYFYPFKRILFWGWLDS